ncbi:unnamed protein product [Adineta steineri]|uniref:Uncharacterized protein n=1 Tax=Adineta steineri TaxID=433720 RepID=A0A818TNN8_9BILA|nr:unnamed protein product [Adineta steineri]CAF3681999.1 unnamed protein product [Adineta steineri]
MSLCEIQSGQLTGRIYSTSKGIYHASSDSIKTNKHQKLTLFSWFLSIFKEIFLPTGYPNTVSNDYLAYQIWDTIQAFASSITNALAFSAILEGLGVGDEKASILSATFVWLIKDGVGMLGRIMFAWFHGTGLDSNLKMWRFYADILNDLATSIDLIAPFFKQFLLPLSCLSNLCRSIVGVAGGSTRAALTQHQAIAHNMGDVSAKDGSQETLVNLLALFVNIVLLHTIKRDRMLVWCLYFILTTLHLYANYKAIRTLKLRTFNWNRFVLLCENYFLTKEIQTVEYINRKEPILREIHQPISCYAGIRLNESQAQSIDLNQFSQNHFAILYSRLSKQFNVCLTDNCDDTDLIKCYFILQYLTDLRHFDQYLVMSSNICWVNVDKLQTAIVPLYQDFLSKAKVMGWDISQAKFLIDNYRYMSKQS